MQNIENRQLRIAMLSVHASPLGPLGTSDTGGMSVYIRELAYELGRSGHRVDIFTRKAGRTDEYEETSLCDRVRLVGIDAGDRGAEKNRLYQHLPAFYSSLQYFVKRCKLRYDLIHSHYWLSGKVGGWASRRWGVPHMIMFHTSGMAKRQSCHKENEPSVRLLNERKLASESTKILAPTERERGLLVKHLNVSPSKISLIPCGVNLKRFYPRDRAAARRAVGVNHDTPVILYVGRFAPVKGMDRLLSSVARLKGVVGLKLLIVGGDGPGAPVTRDVRRMVRLKGLEGTVSFRGRVEHDILPLYYSAADVLAVPSYYESFGLVALEALACGTPVVATRVGAMDMIIRDGETGHVVDNYQSDSFSEALSRFLDSRNRTCLDPDAIRDSVKDYAWSRIASSVASEYVSTLMEWEEDVAKWQNELQRRRIELVC